MSEIIWLPLPEEHDYDAALAYLSLSCSLERAKLCVDGLRTSQLITFKAKDVLRASGLPFLPESNRHVEKDIKKIKNSVPLSPILLVRGDLDSARNLIIADGYHRVCALHFLNEDCEIRCQIY